MLCISLDIVGAVERDIPLSGTHLCQGLHPGVKDWIAEAVQKLLKALLIVKRQDVAIISGERRIPSA